MNADSPSSCLPYREIISGSVISNRYLIQSVLGQGEFGCTYLAVDSYRFYEPCILKEFNPTLNNKNDHFRKKLHYLLKQEAEFLYQLDHAQINKFFAYFHQKERFFIVQEYIQGKSYAQLLQQRQQQGQLFTETEIITWLINLLLLLEYIHDRGIIHRNISLQNIIQSDDRELPILIDFSIGKQSISILQKECQSLPNSINSFSSSLKVNKSFAHKIGYAPYEQIKLGLAFPCSDLYSLGVSAIVLLTGQQPSSLIDGNTLEWRWSSYANASEPFTRIIHKLLAYNPKHRYQLAREVLQDLQPLQQINNLPAPKKPPLEPIVIEPNKDSNQFKQNPIIKQEETALLKQKGNRINKRMDLLDGQRIIPNNTEKTRETLETLSSSQSVVVNDSNYAPSAKFIRICQQKLAYYIGPIANLIIEELLNSHRYLSKEELIIAIATEIPDWQQSMEFQQAIQTETILLT